MEITEVREPWCIGDIGASNPYPLKFALKLLSISSLTLDFKNRDKELEWAFTEFLHENGIVYVDNIESGEGSDYSNIGRAWFSSLEKMGFITPKLSRNTDVQGIDPRLQSLIGGVAGLSGRPYEITPQGRRLINADTLVEEQECFLRAIVARQPNPFTPTLNQPASILNIILKIMAALEAEGNESSISFEEMASIVQFVVTEREVVQAVEKIIAYRDKRAQAKNKKVFDKEFRYKTTQPKNDEQFRTFGDYADMNRRYLRASGLFSLRGRSITFADRKRSTIEQLLSRPFVAEEKRDYFSALWDGANLPTDYEPEARHSIQVLSDVLLGRGEPVSVPDLMPLPIQDLTQIRFKLEQQLERLQEEEFAARQQYEWREILDYMADLLRSKTRRKLVPPSEDPAYFEWSIWRAFLAIDSLVNKPSEARRFQVDQDFLPVRTAPGNTPDMVFEFDTFALVVEVTLSGGSRQEAMEGEPVRRHVARAIEDYERAGKEVYGLFIAIEIDTNTAETFRIGTWYKRDDSRLTLRIVPLRLDQFVRIFEFGFSRGRVSPEALRQVLDTCLSERSEEAPVWKGIIEQIVSSACVPTNPIFS
ncbi:MAG TPA: AlwI family type II restriction endonuclease [Pyrinomonadaceae bacterium]|jgi:hypothetical protein